MRWGFGGFARGAALASPLGAALAGAALAAAGALQDRPGAPFVDAARVDSLRADLTPQRIMEMRRAAADGGDHDVWYEIGSALVLAGQYEEAVEALQRAGGSRNGELERATAYNLGVARAAAGRPSSRQLLPGVMPGGSAADAMRSQLGQARDAFRRVLRDDPTADDARWNLEVVESWLSRLGGEGGGQGSPQGGGQGGDPSDERRELTPEEIERLLETAAAEERRVQGDRFERSRARDPVAERNW